MVRRFAYSFGLLLALVSAGSWIGLQTDASEGKYVGASIGTLIWLIVRPRMTKAAREAASAKLQRKVDDADTN